MHNCTAYWYKTQHIIGLPFREYWPRVHWHLKHSEDEKTCCFLSAGCGESLWTMFHELCWLPVSSWAVEQTLLCMQLISCVAVWQRQQYPSSAVEIHDKLEGPSLGPLGGDTDNYTGAKFRINTSLIVRTSIRRIESAPPFSMHHISCLKICILTPEISSSWEK